MGLSYWEYRTWLSNVDFTVVGSGIVGLNCAINLKKRFPKAKILVLERGVLPLGASTKNAGFACFGSISEILSDLKSHGEDEVVRLVQKRWDGVKLLRNTLGDATLGFYQHGGHELFLDSDTSLFKDCKQAMDAVNELLRPVFRENPFLLNENCFDFHRVKPYYITNRFEGQIDTGNTMQGLLRLAQQQGISLLNGVSVKEFSDSPSHIGVSTDTFEFKTKKLLIATNGFASKLLNVKVEPARAQVLITKPIPDLHIKGCFHFDEGYYYFRNIDDRILLGGGRNLDFKTERTDTFGETQHIQTRLDNLLKTIILPNVPFEVERRWSGIMGMGARKHPIVKQLSDNVYCGVRLGGMGIAIGSLVGKELADLI